MGVVGHSCRKTEKTNGGYVIGIAVHNVLSEAYRKESFRKKQARREENRRTLRVFIEFFSEKMIKMNPGALQLIKHVLFDEWEAKNIAKQVPQATIQIKSLLECLGMFETAEYAEIIYQEFKDSWPERL